MAGRRSFKNGDSFPRKLPTFRISYLAHRMGECSAKPGEDGGGSMRLLTDAGSNTTGSAAEKLDRRWLAFENDRTYLASSAFRFLDELPSERLATHWSRLHSDDLPLEVSRHQRELVLMEMAAEYAVKRKRK